MKVFSFSFQNLKGRPNEDYYLISSKHPLWAVADGITRTKNKKGYPLNSGARLAAEEFCKTVINYLENNFKKANLRSVKKAFDLANRAIFNLNEKYGINKKINYLENDYFSTCGAAAFIKRNILFYGYVGDCGIRIYDKNNLLRLISIDDISPLEELRDQKFRSEKERLIFWRKFLRNKPKAPYLTYGVFTGEPEVKHYYHLGKINLQKGDLILIYSDGAFQFVKNLEFIKLLKKQLLKETNKFIKKEIKLQKITKATEEKFFDDKTLISVLF